MAYLFKALTTRKVRISANNIDDAIREYIDNHVAVRFERTR